MAFGFPTPGLPKAMIRPRDKVFSFMMSPTRGRVALEDEAHGQFVITYCGCSSRDVVWHCDDCGADYCDLCIRLDARHRPEHKRVRATRSIPVLTQLPRSFCNACRAVPLPLPYYHCLVCPDFDLCAACEAINDLLAQTPDRAPLHDPTHPMMKLRTLHS
jgi:hypothetical protein